MCSAIALVACAILPGCGISAYMAATKPPRKDLDMLRSGTPRRALVGEFGLPEESGTADDGSIVDVWNFAQGDYKWVKGSKTVAYILADIGTLGLWEIVGIPTEILSNRDERTYVVVYDADSRVRSVTTLGKRGYIEQAGAVG